MIEVLIRYQELRDKNRNTPMTHRSVEERARFLMQQLVMQRHARLDDDLALMAEHFPGVVADAQQFVRATHRLPWELSAAFSAGTPQVLIEKYGVPPGRQRPDADMVAPVTILFCEACNLVFAQLFGAPPA